MTESWPDIRAVYDAVAQEYAAAFADELDAKPFDRELLAEFAAACPGRIYDVGCGAAGHVTRFLADRGADVTGIDVSSASIDIASAREPALRFEVADMCQLPCGDGALGGLVAFYSVIHLPREQVPVALAEFRRVLRPGGVLLVSMHGGTGEIQSDGWFGRPVSVRATLWALPDLMAAIEAAGFVVRRHYDREPYAAEHPTRRLYVWAEPSELGVS
jgi:SAM-dependent methyltransferase